MTSDSSEWDEDLPPDPEEEYQTFIRTLERTEGFRLLFVRCTPVEGEQLIARVKDDLSHKTIEVLRLDKPIYNLYEIVEQLPNREQVNILFIQGLEHSFYEYEQVKFGDTDERNFYSWKGVPRILNHLNQHRERFRDTFDICFVFLLRPFSLKYFIHRASDFFDWRSSVFEFPTTPEIIEQESSRILQEADYEEYLTLTPEERIKTVLDIQELLEENHQKNSYRANLLLALGNLSYAAKDYKAALTAYLQAAKIKLNSHQAWYNLGLALEQLERHKEAIASYAQALKIKPDKHEAWYARGNALENLGRYEVALAAFDQAVKIKPDDHEVWYARGVVLNKLGRDEEALASYNQAVKIKPDDHDAWNNRGWMLANLGRYQEALVSYAKAIAIKPDFDWPWYNRGNALRKLGRLEEAITSYDQALKAKPDKHEAWHGKGYVLGNLGRYEEAVASYDQAVKLKPEYHPAWYNRGNMLRQLGQHEEAIASYEQALKAKPDKHEAWYNKAGCYALLGNVEQAIENLQQAINLSSDNYRKMAKTDSKFDRIRKDKRFQALIQEPLPGN